MKMYWMVRLTRIGFESLMLVYGTEEELREYMTFEFGYMPAYSAAGDAEVEMAKKLRIKAYLAPEVKRPR